MTREDIKGEIVDIQNDLHQNRYDYDAKETNTLKRKIRKLKKQLINITPKIIPGGTIELSDYIIQINQSINTEKPMHKFFKHECYNYSDEELSILKKMLGSQLGIYNHFLKHASPKEIKRIELECVKEEVESSNIYDKICAPQYTKYRYEFEILGEYNMPPVTVTKTVTENTTLSQSDVRAFM